MCKKKTQILKIDSKSDCQVSSVLINFLCQVINLEHIKYETNRENLLVYNYLKTKTTNRN